MEKENFLASFQGLEYTLDHHHHHHQHQHQHQHQQKLMKTQIGETSGHNSHQIVDYMLNDPHEQQQQHISSRFCNSIVSPLDKLSFAEVTQFADFGPKLALNQPPKVADEENGIDPVYFLKFPVLNDRSHDGDGGDDDDDDQSLMVLPNHHHQPGGGVGEERFKGVVVSVEDEEEEDEEARGTSSTSVQLRNILGENHLQKKLVQVEGGKNKRKRPRSLKTSEEVESQRMTHIAVERNRRKQMNEHLRVLRALMPGSYVQRGDQASIIGGAIEFVRELEQLLQCLESQKRRRLYDDAQRSSMGDVSSLGGGGGGAIQQQPQLLPPFFPNSMAVLENDDQLKSIVDLESEGVLLHEETAESKSCFANVEVKLLGFDAMIKILSKRQPAQLIRTIAALEDLQLIILHTNITTIDQTVLYSFNVKVPGEARFTAEDIASSVQEIFSFLHTNSSI